VDCASPTSSFCSPEAVLAALLTLFWEPLPEFVEVPLLAATSSAPETKKQGVSWRPSYESMHVAATHARVFGVSCCWCCQHLMCG
jgi:hypothetical protein